MAEFLTTAGTAHHLERIITQARARLVLISPFLKLSPVLFERLQDAERRGIAPQIVYGKDELRPEQQQQLSRLERTRLLFLENLHAKCYMNESSMVITSMNMYEFSERRNREMGVLLPAGHPAYQDAADEVESILAAARPSKPPREEKQPWWRPKSAVKVERAPGRSPGGHCIRCRDTIPLNADRPFCRECFDIWALFQNPDYPEQVCHACGAEHEVSMARPLCRSCFIGIPSLPASR